MNPSRILPLLAAAGLAVGLTACGGENLVLPSEGEPASIELVQGDGLSGRVGETLPQPLILAVSDITGRPVAGATVIIELDGAEARPDTAVTELDGRAMAEVVLGPQVGPAPGMAWVPTGAGQRPIEVRFTVNAVASSANGLALVSGNEQTAPAGSELAEPLVVQVTDAFGNPISGVPIAWTPVGGGSVSEAATTSDESGRASVTRILGNAAGTQTTLAASEGLAGSPVTFTHTATPGDAAGVSIVSGNGQSGAPGSQLAQPLVVRVTDGDGNPVSGAAVTWVVTGGGGSLEPATNTTDASGQASANWTLGSSPGANSAEAVVSGVGQASFQATASAAGPEEIRIVSGDGQTGSAGQRLDADFVVVVLDASDDPIAGVTVTWQVRSGGGSVTPTTATTDGNGRASARLTLGTTPGANSVEASVGGAGSVTFQATGTAGAASALALTTQPSTNAESGTPFTRQPVVQLRDGAGNDVARSGVAVTAAVSSGDGSLGGTRTRTTDANGRAAFTDLEIGGAVGPHRLIFAADGFSSVTSDPIEVARASTTTSITGHDPEPSAPGQAVTVSFTVTSGAGTPTGTVRVTAAGGSESCSDELDGGRGSCAITLNGENDRELTASYEGTSLFAPSSDTESHRVEVPNSRPTAADNVYDAPATGDRILVEPAPGVLANDSDPDGDELAAELVTGVSHGTLSLNADGGFSYTPDPGFATTAAEEDSFTYRATDGSSVSDPARVTIRVPAPE